MTTELTGFQRVRLFQLFALAFNQNKTVHTTVLRVNVRLPWEMLGLINNSKNDYFKNFESTVLGKSTILIYNS